MSLMTVIKDMQFQKQPSRGVLKESCSKDMQQIYRREQPCRSVTSKSCFATLLKSYFGMIVLL